MKLQRSAAGKSEWEWPINDSKLLQVFDQVEDIDHILPFVDGRSVCVQAGGACGVWPYRLAQEFGQVYTFEPQPENYRCLLENLEGIDNVITFPLALSDGLAMEGSMCLHPSEEGNCGAWYFEPGAGTVAVMAVDNLDLRDCDLIQMDIEGHEYEALQGARETLMRCRPTVVIEEKKLPQQADADITRARKFLESLGYREVGRVHRDVIFRC